MRRRKREVEVFNLSFLDVVSCGFGAIILLLVLAKVAEPSVLIQLAQDQSAAIARLSVQQQQLQQSETQDRKALVETSAAQDRIAADLQRLRRVQAILAAKLADIQGGQGAETIVEKQLFSARQSLTEEMKRLLRNAARQQPEQAKIGGIPVDSEYVIFIIDTSGSMHQVAWSLVLKKVGQVLRIYPHVKGIQVMNDMGEAMFSEYGRRWIPDTPARRKAIIKRLATWAPFSNSSPVEGIEQAIRRFAAADKRISLYVFGDDFSRGSIETVLNTVASLNGSNRAGKPRVRIHAMGFPTLFAVQGGVSQNAINFAALMRALSDRNGGSFVGLNNVRR